MVYKSVYPPAYNSTYVKSTTEYAATYAPHLVTDPGNTITGAAANNSWSSADALTQRFHIDLGSAKIIKRIYLENFHDAGSADTYSAKNFTFWGSNDASAFAQLAYATDTNWTQLTTDPTVFTKHPASDAADPQYAIVTNTTAYRYYAFKFADNYGASAIGVRRIELQTGINGGGFFMAA